MRWAASGRELIIGTQDGLMAVPFTPGPTPIIGKPALLIGISADVVNGLTSIDPAPDGKRFAALYRGALPRLTDIRVVTNWHPDREGAR